MKKTDRRSRSGLLLPGSMSCLPIRYPIFPKHLTIPSVIHTPQTICGRLNDMLDLARAIDRYIVFYNGPRCGASAPDHMHFQAGNKGFVPLQYLWSDIYREQGEAVYRDGNILLGRLERWPQSVFFVGIGTNG